MPITLPPVKTPDMPPVHDTIEEKPAAELTKEQQENLGKAGDKLQDKLFKASKYARKPQGEKDKENAETAEKEKTKTEGKTTEAKVEKKEAKVEEKVETAPAKAVKKTLKPKPVEKKPEVDLEKLVSSTVAATAKAVREASPEVKPEEVPSSRTEEYAAIKKAETDGLARKGAAEDARKAFKLEQEYVAQWKKDHPGESFDAESGEHDKFYEENVPEWIEDATEAGREAIAKSAIMEEARKEAKKELEPLQEKLSAAEMREQQRVIHQSSEGQVRVGIGLAISALNPELLKEGVKIDEVDPLAHEIMLQVGPEIAATTQEALMLFATEGRSFQDDKTNKPEELARHVLHTKILSTAESLENDFTGRSDEELTQPDGKMFATRAQWNSMSAPERAKHWIVTGELVALKLANDAADKAKIMYDTEQKRIERLTKRPTQTQTTTVKSSNGTKPHVEQTAEEVNDDEVKPRSPSTAADTAIRPGVTVTAQTSKNGADRMVSRMFGRS